MNTPINVEMLHGFITTNRLFGHHNKNININIDVKTDPITKHTWFVVKEHKCVVYTGPEISDAIVLYNHLLSK